MASRRRASARREPATEEVVSDLPAMRRAHMALPPTRGGSVVQLFTNVNLCKQHNGLMALCEAYDIDPTALEPGQYVGFTNKKRDKLKILTTNGVLAAIRLPPGHFVTLETMAIIPAAFKGPTHIDYPAELRRMFVENADMVDLLPPEVEELPGRARRTVIVRPRAEGAAKS